MKKLILSFLILGNFQLFAQTVLIENVVHTSAQKISFKHFDQVKKQLYFTSANSEGVLIYDFKTGKTILDTLNTRKVPKGYFPMNDIYTYVQHPSSIVVINSIAKDTTFIISPFDSVALPPLTFSNTTNKFYGIVKDNKLLEISMNESSVESIDTTLISAGDRSIKDLHIFKENTYYTIEEEGKEQLYLNLNEKGFKKLRYPLNYGESTYALRILNEDTLIVARSMRLGEHQLALMFASNISTNPDTLGLQRIFKGETTKIDSVLAEKIISENEFTQEMNRSIGKGRWSLLFERTTDALKAMTSLNKILAFEPNAFSYKKDSVYYILGPKHVDPADLSIDSIYYRKNGLITSYYDLAEDSTMLPSDIVIRIKCLDKQSGMMANFNADFYDYNSNTLIKGTHVDQGQVCYFSYFPDYTLGLTITSQGYLPHSMSFAPSLEYLSNKRVEKLILLRKPSEKENTFTLNNVYFAFDSAKLSEVAKRELALINNSLSKLNVFTIEGHTDNIGSEKYNNALSKRRAQSVKNHLKELGNSSTIITVGKGESFPIDSNETELGRRKNRRCEFILN
jgi:outer membrane protein OmpA-like peptidoglycan-associated protein